MTNGKKDILIIMGRYLPGYKDGGPVRSIKNLVDYLGEEYNFKILTCDRDHGDTKPYSEIRVKEWNRIGNADVYYVPPKGFSRRLIVKLSEQVDMLYICGCFNDYAINALFANRLGQIKVPVVVAAMGLFSPMAFKIKYAKKKAFVSCFNLLGIFQKVYWSATSDMEAEEIRKQINTSYERIYIAEDLPRKVSTERIVKEKNNCLKVVWISRIAEKKNLKGAIQILEYVKENVQFVIYGPIHEKDYWNKCLADLNRLPKNIHWKYAGEVNSEEVVEVLKEYHVFLFPTYGENYGHVIQEALSAGCAVILSDQTPWKDLEKEGVGNVFSLQNLRDFSKAIDFYASMSQDEIQEVADKALKYAIDSSNEKVINTGYRKIFA